MCVLSLLPQAACLVDTLEVVDKLHSTPTTRLRLLAKRDATCGLDSATKSLFKVSARHRP